MFSESVPCLREGAMADASAKFTKKWTDYIEEYSSTAPRSDALEEAWNFDEYPNSPSWSGKRINHCRRRLGRVHVSRVLGDIDFLDNLTCTELDGSQSYS